MHQDERDRDVAVIRADEFVRVLGMRQIVEIYDRTHRVPLLLYVSADEEDHNEPDDFVDESSTGSRGHPQMLKAVTDDRRALARAMRRSPAMSAS